MAENEGGVTFVKQKLPAYGQMPGVAFASSDLQDGADGPRILVYGGARNGPCNELWQWTPAGEGWMQVFPAAGEPEPHERTQASLTATSESQAVLFGGFKLNLGAANDVQRVTVSPDDNSNIVATWEACSPSGTAPAPRYGHSATLLGGTIVVYGGQDDKAQMGDVFLLGGLDGGMAWSAPNVGGSVPKQRMSHSACALGPSSLLVFGGFVALDRCMDDAYQLELSPNGDVSWEQLALTAPAGSKSIPARSQHVACATADGRHVYLYGGYDGDKNLADLWLVDLKAATCRSLGISTPAPEARSRHFGHMIGSTMFVTCGTDMMKPLPADVFGLDCDDPGAAVSKATGGDKKDEKKEDKKDDE